MQTMYPERIVAIWCRSGTALAYWERGEIDRPEIPAAVYGIPVVCNPGVRENDHERFHAAWDGARDMFQAYRAHQAPIAFAPDPRTAHECGDSRYLAIPFFDGCLALRLPDKAHVDAPLKPIDQQTGWLAIPLTFEITPAASYSGKAEEAVWLPSRQVADAWAEYVRTGYVTAFAIERDGQPLARVPEQEKARFGRPLFQAMSYHDTPEKPLPVMQYIDRTATAGKKHVYRVFAVNSSDLRSAASAPATLAQPSHP
jgi:hypothetical protein